MRIDRVGRRGVQPPVAPVPRLRRPPRPGEERSSDDGGQPDRDGGPDAAARDDDEGLGGHLDLLA